MFTYVCVTLCLAEVTYPAPTMFGMTSAELAELLGPRVHRRRRASAMRLSACGLLWCSLRSAIGAANLQDHSESWAAAGLADQLVQARADAMRAGLGFGWLVEEGSKGAAAGRPVAAGSAVR